MRTSIIPAKEAKETANLVNLTVVYPRLMKKIGSAINCASKKGLYTTTLSKYYLKRPSSAAIQIVKESLEPLGYAIEDRTLVIVISW